MPTIHHPKYRFPTQGAYLGNVKRPYKTLGLVRSKVEYPSLDPGIESDTAICRNYFNKAAKELLARAKQHGGDAVIDIKSVVFLEDGRAETYSRPECSDDGEEGQILMQGIAVKWKTKRLDGTWDPDSIVAPSTGAPAARARPTPTAPVAQGGPAAPPLPSGDQSALLPIERRARVAAMPSADAFPSSAAEGSAEAPAGSLGETTESPAEPPIVVAPDGFEEVPVRRVPSANALVPEADPVYPTQEIQMKSVPAGGSSRGVMNSLSPGASLNSP